jgi:hypothetical protein
MTKHNGKRSVKAYGNNVSATRCFLPTIGAIQEEPGSTLGITTNQGVSQLDIAATTETRKNKGKGRMVKF